MNKLIKGCLAAVMVIGAISMASAEFVVGTEYGDYGVYLGIYEGNDKNTDVAGNVLGEIETLVFDEKTVIQEKLGGLTLLGDNEDGAMVLTSTITDDGEIIGGTWSSGTSAIDFYAVKAGNLKVDKDGNITKYGGYTVWYVDGATDGMFTTEGLGNPFRELSHLSGYTSSTTSVPEPTMLSLLGFGLISMSALRFRRKK